MARSQSIQFGWFSRGEALAILENLAQIGDTQGDRVALSRRAHTRAASRAEVARNEEYLNSLGHLGPWRAYRFHD